MNSLGTTCNAIKQNVEIQILYLECQWKPHKSIIFIDAGMNKYYGFWHKMHIKRLKGVHTLLAQSQLNVQNQGIKGAQ